MLGRARAALLARDHHQFGETRGHALINFFEGTGMVTNDRDRHANVAARRSEV
jgi:hypothetical protein